MNNPKSTLANSLAQLHDMLAINGDDAANRFRSVGEVHLGRHDALPLFVRESNRE